MKFHPNWSGHSLWWSLKRFTKYGLITTGLEIKNFWHLPDWVVAYITYTKFHSPRPVFHSPGQIFTHIGERASISFPACNNRKGHQCLFQKIVIFQFCKVNLKILTSLTGWINVGQLKIDILGDELSFRQAQGWHTHVWTHTQTDYNTQRSKLASGKKYKTMSYIS